MARKVGQIVRRGARTCSYVFIMAAIPNWPGHNRARTEPELRRGSETQPLYLC
jgi:hypothetical protein